MNSNLRLKVIELRNYLLKPRVCERFSNYFEDHFIDSQNLLHGFVLGQFRIKGDEDRFFWIRGFEDMQTRLTFLRKFYEQGEVWKQFGSGANDMMIDSDNVYLLKPLGSESFGYDEFAKGKGIVVIESCFVRPNHRDELADLFQANHTPHLKSEPILCVSEMAENDFPRLPVIQDENLLVAITVFRDESDYQSHLKQSTGLKDRMQEVITSENSLILYPTAKSFMGSGGLPSPSQTG
jgi:quinol monooxygenase YgiN